MSETQKDARPERYWPKDPLGNEIRKGQLVTVRIPEQIAVMRVGDVIEAGFTSGKDKIDKIEMQGAVTLIMQIPYRATQLIVAPVLCLKEPETTRIHRV